MLPPPTPVAVVAPASYTSPPSRYGFRRAELGMDLASWRASSPRRAKAACAETAVAGVTRCRVDPAPIGGAFRARQLTHTFVGGRLAKISFESSVDAFAHTTAMLDRDFGSPTSVVRDHIRLTRELDLPHVAMAWRNDRSTIRLDDPVSPGGVLRVTYTLDADHDRLVSPRG